MKKTVISAIAALIAFVAIPFSAAAQMGPTPVDKDVRIGKLDNGLTYYIRHNETPKGQADFYIAQKVGSALEEDSQRGLAHFLEHMCFNGTENFPGNQLISWLETVGVKFGANLNAYTAVDETVYNISNVPTDREGVQDSCLLILHDWSDGLLLDPAEIDKERGVIHQEWRRSNVGQMRILEQLLPVIYQGEKYGYRLPIGTMEVVDNFPAQVLRDYYETWYRPDQQAIIVVGDIDVDRIENKIKEIFSPIKMPAEVKERVYAPVSDNQGTIYAIGKDPEQTIGIAQLYIKHDVVPDEMKGDMTYLVIDYITDMIRQMMNQRFSDLQSDPNTAFAQAAVFDGNFLLAKTKDALTLVAVAKDNDVRPAFESAYRELLRASRGGFTMSEYDRARSEYLSRIEKQYNERNNTQSGNYVDQYVRNFIDNEPIPSIEDYYQVINMIAPNIPVEAINQTLAQLVTPDNRVLIALTPDNGTFIVPSEKDFTDIIAKVDGETIEAYVDEVKSEPLIANLPAPGKIVAEKQLDQWGATELTLSNGVRVIVKPTTFKDDEIILDATAKNGTAFESDDLANELILIDQIEILSQPALGTYTNKDLKKYLQGKQVAVKVKLDDYTRDVEGSSTVKDLPVMMELLYATFTEFGLDAQEYEATQKQISSILAHQEKDPNFIFSQNLMKSLFNNPRNQVVTSDMIMAADRQKIVEIAQRALANAADYTFVFTGKIDMNTFRPLVEQYIATLPANASKVAADIKYNNALKMNGGNKVDTYTTKMETPQTYVAIVATAEVPFTAKDRAAASIAGQIMSKRLLETVREDMGAVYSIGAVASLSRTSDPNLVMQSSFPMKPEMKQQVLDFIANEFKAMESNVTADELAKVVEYMVKNAKEGKELNDTWNSAIAGWLLNGVDTFNGNVELYNSLTVDDIQNLMKKLNAAGNYRTVILDPAE